MKYGILGDIHANLSALKTVLECMTSEGMDCLLSVGDVVGYGAAPGECISLLREHDVDVVQGNHDRASVGLKDAQYFNPAARAAVEWTGDQLSRLDRSWLTDLPPVRTYDHALLTHASLFAPERFDYVFDPEEAEPSLDIMSRPVCFVGHTHLPCAFVRTAHDPVHTAFSPDTFFDLSEIDVAMVNVGSVGQPRDGDPRAAFAIFDSDARTLRIERVTYDVEREAARITAAGLPESLASRLFLGR